MKPHSWLRPAGPEDFDVFAVGTKKTLPQWAVGSSLISDVYISHQVDIAHRFVEPRLVGNLDVVSVRVADVCREVVGAPFRSKARLLLRSSSRVDSCLVAGPDSVRALGGECDVKVFGDRAVLQPEARLAIDGKPEDSLELVGHIDAKRLKHLLEEFARPIQIRDGKVNMVNNHGFPPFRLFLTAPTRVLLNPDRSPEVVLHVAAVREDDFPGEPARIIRGKKYGHARDVLRLAHAAQRRTRDYLLLRLRSHDARRVRTLRFGSTRIESVNADFSGAELF